VSRLTFENRRDYPSCPDQLFFSPSRFFKSRFLVEVYLRRDIYQDRRDKSRLSRFIETFKIHREFLRFLDIIETFSTLFLDFRL
jgi:hypothetical protein